MLPTDGFFTGYPPTIDATSEIEPRAQRRVVFVIGAERSSTRLLVRRVPALGVDLDDCCKQPFCMNSSRCYEDIDLLRLSKAVRMRRLGPVLRV